MKIDLSSVAGQNVPATNSSVSKPTNTFEKVREGDAGVHLGGSVQRLANLSSEVLNAPEVRARKVEQLKAAIAEGRYAVGSEQVARKLMAEIFRGE